MMINIFRCNDCETKFDTPKLITKNTGLIISNEVDDFWVCPCCESMNYESTEGNINE